MARRHCRRIIRLQNAAEAFRKIIGVSLLAALYPEVRFLHGSSGRIGCRNDQILCVIDWSDVDRSKLCRLSFLEYIAEFRGSHLE